MRFSWKWHLSRSGWQVNKNEFDREKERITQTLLSFVVCIIFLFFGWPNKQTNKRFQKVVVRAVLVQYSSNGESTVPSTTYYRRYISESSSTNDWLNPWLFFLCFTRRSIVNMTRKTNKYLAKTRAFSYFCLHNWHAWYCTVQYAYVRYRVRLRTQNAATFTTIENPKIWDTGSR